MMNLFNTSIIVIYFLSAFAVNQLKAQENTEPEFEMKTYYFVFLNAAPNRPVIDSAKAMEIQAGHMAHMNDIFKQGKLKLAGPFMDGGETRGIWILDVATEEEAKEICSKDPAVINGRLNPVIKQWYGPAGLKVEPKGSK
jgi:uncharacterized protein YciI